MKNHLFKAFVSFFLCTLTLIGTLCPIYADGSHGFFMDCDASVVDDKADGFMIDFYSDSDEALCTYWSNANWSMYTDATSKLMNTTITEGGAYAGLQLRGSQNDRTGIMSLWRYKYFDKQSGQDKYIYAKALYGKTTTYDNEGSGTSCVMPYPWKNHQWYRQLLLCWQDAETGKTFIGTWFYDYEADKWTLFAYYDTFLYYSYIKGDIGQFLENFSESEGARYRSPTIDIRSDGNPKAFGEVTLEVSEDGTYVFAAVDGKSEIDTDHTVSLKPTLKQSATPTVGTPEIGNVQVKDRKVDGKIVESRLVWQMAEHSTPQLSYKVTVTDANGKVLKSKSGTRPEVDMLELGDLNTDAYKCEITVTDVFGKTASTTYYSESYPKNDPVTPPETSDKPQSTDTPAKNPFPVLPVALTGTAVLAVALTVFMIIKRKKG